MTQPSCANCRRASRTGVMLIPICSASGARRRISPDRARPMTIASRMSSAAPSRSCPGRSSRFNASSGICVYYTTDAAASDRGTATAVAQPDAWPSGKYCKQKDEMPVTVNRIRVVVAKPGLDGHDRGAKIIARALRDAGMEVIYTGLHQTPEQIAETVIQEDADAVGLSILSDAHMTLVPKVVELLKAQGVDDVLVTVGGTIPADDIPELKKLGVAEVFTPGAGTDDIVDFIRVGAAERHAAGA